MYRGPGRARRRVRPIDGWWFAPYDGPARTGRACSDSLSRSSPVLLSPSMRAARAAALSLALPASVWAQRPAPPDDAPHAPPPARAVRAAGPIHVDGHLDEAAWQAAPPTTTFTQVDPVEGVPASQATEVRVLYDDEALYVGVRLHDTEPVTARLGRRDMPLGDSDWFGLMIDSYHDHRTAFGFDVNPLGVRRDEVKTIDVDDNSWDAVWDVATSIDAGGWTAEYRVPFSQLRFRAAADQTWGVQFERVIGRNHEYDVSTFTPKAERGGVPRYGHLVGLHDIQPGKRLELLPYTVEKAAYVNPGPDPFTSDPTYTTSVGLDVRYRVASNLTLNATFNPDFGQVELDPAVVNLGVYETFYEEKRPFFIEGSEIFDFGAGGTSGGQLFYSRRIGHAPTLAAPTAESHVPDVTTILGAAKLTGKPGGWSVGMLEAVTAREEARYRSPTVPDGRTTVEPLTNYVVARARRELRGGHTMIGAIASAVNRRLTTDPLRDTLRSAGYATGIDFRHEWANQSWIVYGDAEVSRVEGSAGAITATERLSNHFFQRPDATHLHLDQSATSLSGYAMNVALGKQAGLHWRGEVAAAVTSPGYEVNDMGFSYRTDRRDGQVKVTYVEQRPGPMLRNWSITALGRSEHNFAWQPILTFVTLNPSVTLLNYWTATVTLQRYFQALDDRLTRGGPIAVRPAWWSGTAEVTSDGRKPVTLDLTLNGNRYDFGGWDWTAGATIGVKASTRWNLTVGPTFSRAHTTAQYVGTVPDSAYAPTYGARYVFAPLDQASIGLEARFNVTFTRTLSLETYTQPLLSSADYGAPVQLVAPHSYDFTAYGGAVPNLDFNLRSLRGNAVLRWEWRPGSTLYVAWQQQRETEAPIGDFSFGRDERALFATRPDNVFLVKVSYWINP